MDGSTVGIAVGGAWVGVATIGASVGVAALLQAANITAAASSKLGRTNIFYVTFLYILLI